MNNGALLRVAKNLSDPANRFFSLKHLKNETESQTVSQNVLYRRDKHSPSHHVSHVALPKRHDRADISVRLNPSANLKSMARRWRDAQ